MTFFTDSRAAMGALSGRCVKERTVLNRKREVDVYSGSRRLSLVWIPAHYGVEGNKRAVELAVNGSRRISLNLFNSNHFRSTKKEFQRWAREI